jgi:hypothetical protein
MIKDSGSRSTFPTGSQRDSREGKGRYDLIPTEALRRVAVHYEKGAKKYGERDWEKGQPIACFMDSALRHLQNHNAGDRSEDHLAAAAWNVLCLMETEHRIGLGQLPKYLAQQPVHLIGRNGDEKPASSDNRGGTAILRDAMASPVGDVSGELRPNLPEGGSPAYDVPGSAMG